MNSKLDDRLELMRTIINAPSACGLEGMMTYNVLEPLLKHVIPEHWIIHKFKGNYGIVIDTNCENKNNSTMIIAHTDKVTMRVKKIGEDGKIYITCDSVIPSALLGHKVRIFADKNDTNTYTQYNGIIQGLGAIHHLSNEFINGKKSVNQYNVYVDLEINDPVKIEELGIKTGDAILFDNPIQKTYGSETFNGAYLDNGVGCISLLFLIEEIIKNDINHQIYFAFATHEEIGLFGSRVLVNSFKPDIVMAIDAGHDYIRAPGLIEKNYPDIGIGNGTIITKGSVTSPFLNNILINTCKKYKILYQVDIVERQTGTDAMASFFSSNDAMTVSVGIPVSHEHSIAEGASYIDILESIKLMYYFLQDIGKSKIDETIKLIK